LEWVALPGVERPDGGVLGDGGGVPGAPLGTPFRIGGQVLSIDLDAFDGGQSLLGTLSPKGSERLALGTRALALEASRSPERAPRRMGVVLDGELIAALAITTTVRGRYFRVPTVAHWPPSTEPLEAMVARLRQAAAADRRCFAGVDP